MRTSDFKDLVVWQIAMGIVTDVYKNIIKQLPNDERYSLGDQIRRAAVSIPSNIAEGHGRNSTKEFVRFLRISRGSLCELDTQLILCDNLKFISPKVISSLTYRLNGLDILLCKLIKSIDTPDNP